MTGDQRPSLDGTPTPGDGLNNIGHKGNWYWAAVPLLAVAAYITVLRVGFLGEDFLGLDLGRTLGLGPQLWQPGVWPDYSPLGNLITFVAGWNLWGANPFPYHVTGLLCHAGVALLLGLWLARTFGSRERGLLAGALFAVFPIHIEAVAWVSAYNDLLAALFLLASLLLFVGAFQDEGPRQAAFTIRPSSFGLYAASFVLYACAIFTSESVIAMLPLYALSAWMVVPFRSRRDVGRLLSALLPFSAALALNIGLRLNSYGSIGGYQHLTNDYGDFFWNTITSHFRALLAPINPAVLGSFAAQLAGALSTVGLLVGLILFGWEQKRLLLLALTWAVCALVPILNLPIMPGNLENNHYLYLLGVGYCVGVAVLGRAAILALKGRWQVAALAAVPLLLVLFVGVSWLHLRPWHTATTQVESIIDELARAIPPQKQPDGVSWYIANTPRDYHGAMLFQSGIDSERSLFFSEDVTVITTTDAPRSPISDDPQDAFALRFYYDKRLDRFPLDYVAGITHPAGPPENEQAGPSLRVWDFRACTEEATGAWQPHNAIAGCEPGKGIIITPQNDNPQLFGPDLNLDLKANPARWVRVRVAARHPHLEEQPGHVLEWSWRFPDADWNDNSVQRIPVRGDGKTYVYWIFFPATDMGNTFHFLRFDPINVQSGVEVEWIALDLVK